MTVIDINDRIETENDWMQAGACKGLNSSVLPFCCRAPAGARAPRSSCQRSLHELFGSCRLHGFCPRAARIRFLGGRIRRRAPRRRLPPDSPYWSARPFSKLIHAALAVYAAVRVRRNRPGSANLDLVVRTERHPSPGETLLGDDFSEYPGGKGLNQAVAAARSGASTSFVGAIGTDGAGRTLRSVAEIDGSTCRSSPTATVCRLAGRSLQSITAAKTALWWSPAPMLR